MSKLNISNDEYLLLENGVIYYFIKIDDDLISIKIPRIFFYDFCKGIKITHKQAELFLESEDNNG